MECGDGFVSKRVALEIGACHVERWSIQLVLLVFLLILETLVDAWLSGFCG
jgi:hypothetical protein